MGEQTVKTEDTLYKFDISRRDVFSSWMSVLKADFSTILALLFAKDLHRFCFWVART